MKYFFSVEVAGSLPTSEVCRARLKMARTMQEAAALFFLLLTSVSLEMPLNFTRGCLSNRKMLFQVMQPERLDPIQSVVCLKSLASESTVTLT